MSAITGICDLRAITGSASASSWLGQATRPMSQPVAVSSAICCSVALMSVVGVVVIDCTETGASPPTSTFPTLTWRERRRSASTGGGGAGMPRSIAVIAAVRFLRRWWSLQPDGVDEVGVDEQHAHHDQNHGNGIGHGQELGDVDVTGVRPTAEPGDTAAYGLVQ